MQRACVLSEVEILKLYATELPKQTLYREDSALSLTLTVCLFAGRTDRATRLRLHKPEPMPIPVGVPVGEPARAAGSANQPPPAVDAEQTIQLVLNLLIFMRDSPFRKLLACVAIDAIGFSSYLLPGVGELGDVVWAPLQAYFLYFMFGSTQIAAVGFFEEMLPGTDFVPTATLGWVSENVEVDTPILDALRTLTGVRLRRTQRRAD
jgi:hypothetical protein